MYLFHFVLATFHSLLIITCRSSISVIAVLSTMALGYLIHQIILNCPPGGSQQPSRADGDRIQQTLRNFSQKKSAVTTRQICSISDAAFEFENLRLSKSLLLPSPSNCFQPRAWVFVVQLGCETQNISKVHPKHISIKHMVCRKCYITKLSFLPIFYIDFSSFFCQH